MAEAGFQRWKEYALFGSSQNVAPPGYIKNLYGTSDSVEELVALSDGLDSWKIVSVRTGEAVKKSEQIIGKRSQ